MARGDGILMASITELQDIATFIGSIGRKGYKIEFEPDTLSLVIYHPDLDRQITIPAMEGYTRQGLILELIKGLE
jgi:hypothetical protein